MFGFLSRCFSSPSELQRLRLPRMPFGQLHFLQVQRRGSVPEEHLQPAALQRLCLPLVCELRDRAGPVHPGRGLLLLLLGLYQTRRHSHLPLVC